MSMKMPKVLQSVEAQWVLLGLVGLVVVYYVVKNSAAAVAGAAGGLVSGNNAITQNQTDANGQPETAYEGAGVLGTLGAAFNSASGGVFASIGNWIGGELSDATSPTQTTDATATAQDTSAVNRDQITTGNWVSDISQLGW